MKLCSASRMVFRAWFYRTDPQNIGGQFGTLSGFLRERAKESPEIYFRAKSFRTIFEKRAPVYSLEAPLLGMAKSIYYYFLAHSLFVAHTVFQFMRSWAVVRRAHMAANAGF